jgi:ubiquinone/menaquinone biosynthesis C-methylase UbiE
LFDIITKEDYWNWLASGVVPTSLVGASGARHRVWRQLLLRAYKRLETIIRPARLYSLKDVQDAFIMSRLGKEKGKRILEVGGGVPRILRWLSGENDVWLIDRYEGVGRGPRVVPRLPGITFIQGYMGEFIQQVPDDYFDYIFSVSVIEHVPLDGLESFFADCSRVLKPFGRMFHAIDTYLFDSDREDLSQPFRERLHAYLQFAVRSDLGIRLEEGGANIDEHTRFSCAYATQPDNVLHEWHLHRPQEKRLRGQVVSIKSAWEKNA